MRITQIENTFREAIRGSIQYQSPSENNKHSRRILEVLDQRKEKLDRGKEMWIFYEDDNSLKPFIDFAQKEAHPLPNKALVLICATEERSALVELAFRSAVSKVDRLEPDFTVAHPFLENVKSAPFWWTTDLEFRYSNKSMTEKYPNLTIFFYGNDGPLVLNKKVVDVIAKTNENLRRIKAATLPDFPGMLSERRIIGKVVDNKI